MSIAQAFERVYQTGDYDQILAFLEREKDREPAFAELYGKASRIKSGEGSLAEFRDVASRYFKRQIQERRYPLSSADESRLNQPRYLSEKRSMEFLNLSREALQAPQLDKRGLVKLIVLPDYSPGKGKLPVGCVAVYDHGVHTPSAAFLGPDIGCGMRLAHFSQQPLEDFRHAAYSVACALQLNNRELGSLGGGNHFINLYQATASTAEEVRVGDFYVLIHSGSRRQGQAVFENDLRGDAYLRAYAHAIDFGKRNRRELLHLVERAAGDVTTVLESIHNTVEVGGMVVYRKGAIKLLPGQLAVIPSSMGGDALIVRGKERLLTLEWSMCHGTGRILSRGEAKAQGFNSGDLRERVYIPSFTCDGSLLGEQPECYRTIEDLIPSITPYVDIVGRLTPKAVVK